MFLVKIPRKTLKQITSIYNNSTSDKLGKGDSLTCRVRGRVPPSSPANVQAFTELVDKKNIYLLISNSMKRSRRLMSSLSDVDNVGLGLDSLRGLMKMENME